MIIKSTGEKVYPRAISKENEQLHSEGVTDWFTFDIINPNDFPVKVLMKYKYYVRGSKTEEIQETIDLEKNSKIEFKTNNCTVCKRYGLKIGYVNFEILENDYYKLNKKD